MVDELTKLEKQAQDEILGEKKRIAVDVIKQHILAVDAAKDALQHSKQKLQDAETEYYQVTTDKNYLLKKCLEYVVKEPK